MTTSHYVVPKAVERLDMMYPPDSKESRFSWPSTAEIVSVNVPETDVERFECWKAVGAGETTRQMQFHSLPQAIRELLPENTRRFHSSITGYFSLHWPLGQEDDWRTRNMIVGIPPTWSWNGSHSQRTLAWPGLRAEIGCKHDYETLAKGNCYRKARCRKCSHTWACDSGD